MFFFWAETVGWLSETLFTGGAPEVPRETAGWILQSPEEIQMERHHAREVVNVVYNVMCCAGESDVMRRDVML